MQSRIFRLICIITVLALGAPAFAQWGHPLKGSWSGEWWLKKGEENRVLLEFNWDGKTLTGVLNPGTENVTLQKLSLEPPGGGVATAMSQWLLQFEADAKDQSGKAVHHVLDGKL